MIRVLLVFLMLILYFLFGIIAWLVFFIVGRFHPHRADLMATGMVRWGLSVILFLSGTKVEIRGKENILKDGAALYVANHRGYFDVIIGFVYSYGLTGFVAKKEFQKIPFFAHWMKLVHCLFLDRSSIKEGMKTILTGISYLKSGINMWIFPEGTRNKNEDFTELLPFHEGSLKMAAKANVPAIPVSIYNSSACWENQFPKIRPAHVVVTFGAPVIISELEGDDKKFPGKYIENIIHQQLLDYKKEFEVNESTAK